MDRLILGFKKGMWTFEVSILPDRRFIKYYCNDNGIETFYELSGEAYKKTYSIYKNIRFEGAITTRNKWQINLGSFGCLMKNGESITLYCENDKVKQLTTNKIEQVRSFEYKESTKQLKEESKVVFCNLYNKINDKQDFEKQLFDYIEDVSDDFDSKQELMEEIRECYQNFIECENLLDNYYNIFTVKEILRSFPDLKKENIDRKTLIRIIEESIDKLEVEADIFTNKRVILEELEASIYSGLESHKTYALRKTYNDMKVLDSLFAGKIKNIENKDYFHRHMFCFIETTRNLTEQEILNTGNTLIEKIYLLEQEIKTIITHYGTNKIIIDLDKEKEERFERYANNEISLSDEESNEFELIYKKALHYYQETFFNKKTKKPNKIICAFPSYIKYVRFIIESLLRHKIIKDNDEKLDFINGKNLDTFKRDVLEYQE